MNESSAASEAASEVGKEASECLLIPTFDFLLCVVELRTFPWWGSRFSRGSFESQPPG